MRVVLIPVSTNAAGHVGRHGSAASQRILSSRRVDESFKSMSIVLEPSYILWMP
jgi:hypothetical protein